MFTFFAAQLNELSIERLQEKAIVFNTYQCYLKIAYHSLILDLEQAARQNFYFGAKLVRGAYMEQVDFSLSLSLSLSMNWTAR